MAEDKKPRPRRPKPLLTIACFCERVLESDDGAISAIRIIDTYTLFIPHDALANPDQRVTVLLTALLAFKSGNVVGDRTLKIVLKLPAGKRETMLEKTLPFKGGEQGVNIRLNLRLSIKSQGVYWMDVLVDGSRVTKMPLTVVFRPLDQMPGGPGQPDNQSP
jgi:hypothetical protein